MGKEYRWEYEDIGQGHYFLTLDMCIKSAKNASKERPGKVVMVEQFRPERKPVVKYVSEQVYLPEEVVA